MRSKRRRRSGARAAALVATRYALDQEAEFRVTYAGTSGTAARRRSARPASRLRRLATRARGRSERPRCPSRSRRDPASSPRVCRCGCRSPTIGGFRSNGMAFLLTVMPAASERRLGHLAGQALGKTSTSIRWLSVPPLTRRKPGHRRAVREPVRRWRRSAARRRERGSERFLQADGLGGDDVHQRPALHAGEDRRSRSFAKARGRGSCRRAGRAASCASSS